MSIIRMEKVAILGLDTVKEELITKLMDIGIVEIHDQSTVGFDEELLSKYSKDSNEEEAIVLDGQVNRISAALETLRTYDQRKKPFFTTRTSMSDRKFKYIISRQEEIQKNVDYVTGLNDELHTMQETINRCNVDLASLRPWVSYDLPLEIKETESCDIDLGVMPISVDLDELRATIKEESDISVLEEINQDKNFRYIVTVSAKEKTADFAEILRKWGYTPVQFTEYTGTVTEMISVLEQRISDSEARIGDLQKEISELNYMITEMECLHDELSMRRDKERIKSSLIKTRRTFALSGWLPERYENKVSQLLDEMNCYYVFEQPAEGEKPPVALKTNKFSTPFAAVTEMYSLPDYDGFDSTNIMSLFYAFFFGLMLSDAGYGLVIFLACAYILHKYPLENTMGKMFRMFEICGIFTIFWGVLFGSYFGDLVQTWASTVFNKTIVIEPLWFSPMEDPTKLLLFSLMFGIIHLFTAMALDIYVKCKRGQVMDAICDNVTWYITIIGIVLWLAGSYVAEGATTVGMYMTIAGFVLLILTGGRHNKGFGKVTGGLAAAYGITSWISDILSYARLLALGLATGVIASVVNMLGAMIGTGFKGAVALLIIGIFGHVFSMAINVLGAFVHSCRLQYVEFFGKFYEDGGEPFKPFSRNTTFVRISAEEEKK